MIGRAPAGAADVWSTSAVEQSHAFEYWCELICDTFVQLSAVPTKKCSFAGQIVHADLAAFEISTVRAGGQRVRRTPRLIARAGEEYLLASIQTKGHGRIEQDGRVAVLDPGSVAVCDSTRPYTLYFDETFEQIVVQVPLGDILAETGLRDSGGVTAMKLGGEGPAGVVAQFFCGLSRIYPTDPQAALSLAAHGRGLMASALLFSRGRVRQATATGSLARQQVVALLRARHGDPTLTVDDVAHGCLVSRRTLYRLFEGTPGGVGSLLRRIRIEHAQALLRADASRSRESIALACGFAGERQFYRVFRRETGCTPGEFRAAGTAGQCSGMYRQSISGAR
jgi:AraC-like DNA-binding protein